MKERDGGDGIVDSETTTEVLSRTDRNESMQIQSKWLKTALKWLSLKSDMKELIKRLEVPQNGIDLESYIQTIRYVLVYDALSKSGGSPGRAASLLKLNRTTLLGFMRRIGYDQFKPHYIEPELKEPNLGLQEGRRRAIRNPKKPK